MQRSGKSQNKRTDNLDSFSFENSLDCYLVYPSLVCRITDPNFLYLFNLSTLFNTIRISFLSPRSLTSLTPQPHTPHFHANCSSIPSFCFWYYSLRNSVSWQPQHWFEWLRSINSHTIQVSLLRFFLAIGLLLYPSPRLISIQFSLSTSSLASIPAVSSCNSTCLYLNRTTYIVQRLLRFTSGKFKIDVHLHIRELITSLRITSCKSQHDSLLNNKLREVQVCLHSLHLCARFSFVNC